LQVVLIANAVVYLALSFITVPLYSLGVQMGSDFRPHIFSPDVKDRLLQIASANKEKVSTKTMRPYFLSSKQSFSESFGGRVFCVLLSSKTGSDCCVSLQYA